MRILSLWLPTKGEFLPYLKTISRRLTSKKKEEVADGLTAMLNQFKAWGHSPGTLRTDAENVFKSVTSTVNGLGWRMEFTQPGRHERKVERFIRDGDVRDRVRTVIDSLKYINPLRDLLPIQTLEETEPHKHLRVMKRVPSLGQHFVCHPIRGEIFGPEHDEVTITEDGYSHC
jgi:hypothetical protein